MVYQSASDSHCLTLHACHQIEPLNYMPHRSRRTNIHPLYFLQYNPIILPVNHHTADRESLAPKPANNKHSPAISPLQQCVWYCRWTSGCSLWAPHTIAAWMRASTWTANELTGRSPRLNLGSAGARLALNLPLHTRSGVAVIYVKALCVCFCLRVLVVLVCVWIAGHTYRQCTATALSFPTANHWAEYVWLSTILPWFSIASLGRCRASVNAHCVSALSVDSL